jgi:hypothetical protein
VGTAGPPSRVRVLTDRNAGGRGYAYREDARIVVAAGIDEAFAFLADPRTLPLLDPPRLDTRFVPGPPRDFGLGSEREYVFRWSRFPLYLRLRVAEFEPPRRLVLAQVLGPWQRFVQTFGLRRVEDGTEIAEQGEARFSSGVIEGLVHRLIVARELRAITAFRHVALLRHLGDPRRARRSAPDDAP